MCVCDTVDHDEIRRWIQPHHGAPGPGPGHGGGQVGEGFCSSTSSVPARVTISSTFRGRNGSPGSTIIACVSTACSVRGAAGWCALGSGCVGGRGPVRPRVGCRKVLGSADAAGGVRLEVLVDAGQTVTGHAGLPTVSHLLGRSRSGRRSDSYPRMLGPDPSRVRGRPRRDRSNSHLNHWRSPR